jgi:hypothetical protein
VIETLAKSTMLLLFAGSAPIDAPDSSLWFQWGLAGVVIAYVLWRDHQRERRMAAAIDAQQKWIRETLVHALERNAQALERVAAWMEREEPGRGRRMAAVAEGGSRGGDGA